MSVTAPMSIASQTTSCLWAAWCLAQSHLANAVIPALVGAEPEVLR
ncbi:MAG: hypothetical protein WAN02_25685 [Mycobacterium sp.]